MCAQGVTLGLSCRQGSAVCVSEGAGIPGIAGASVTDWTAGLGAGVASGFSYIVYLVSNRATWVPAYCALFVGRWLSSHPALEEPAIHVSRPILTHRRAVVKGVNNYALIRTPMSRNKFVQIRRALHAAGFRGLAPVCLVA